MIRMQNIAVPIDFSENSKKAALYAAELARERNAGLHLLHVINQRLIDVVQELSLKGYDGDTVEATEKMLKEREKDLRDFLDQASLKGLEVEYVLRKGKPGAEIIRFAEESNMDLIVIGTQGRSPLTDALVGSAARTVIHRAPCPVVVVHPYDRLFVE